MTPIKKKSVWIKHGLHGTRIYNIFNGMKGRCYCKEHFAYESYGGRGITVCDEWRNSFQAFYDWAMSNGYRDDLTLDRINNDGNYEPLNCRWITMKEQCSNRRNNHLLTYKGETKTLTEWAELYGKSYVALFMRLKRGWSIEKAIETPLRGGGNYETYSR